MKGSEKFVLPKGSEGSTMSSPFDDELSGLHARIPELRRDQARLIAKSKLMREIKEAAPGEQPRGLSEVDASRLLVHDTLSTLTRAEVVLEAATDALVAYYEALVRDIDVRIVEIDTRRREQDRQDRSEEVARVREARKWSVVTRLTSGIYSWLGDILTDPRTVTAVTASLGTLISVGIALVVRDCGASQTPHSTVVEISSGEQP